LDTRLLPGFYSSFSDSSKVISRGWCFHPMPTRIYKSQRHNIVIVSALATESITTGWLLSTLD
jgi:hypothetical protein